MIVYDHIISTILPGIGPGMVQDGSYEAYELKRGKWIYVEKLFNETQDEPIRPVPILNERKGKDIFGKQKN